ncbi:MAG: divalent-cation tolerance protein CutA [Hyphomicrobium sp.]|nr:divalent-cation tolerance protein CutA [Hyphomicrobium sp.]
MTENNKGRDRGVVEGQLGAECVAALVYTTFPDREAAIAAGRVLVEARHAGCINIIPAMTSVYVWKGVTEVASEVVLIAKVMPEHAAAALEALRRLHPYETPALLVLPVAAGSADYLAWLRAGSEVAI